MYVCIDLWICGVVHVFTKVFDCYYHYTNRAPAASSACNGLRVRLVNLSLRHGSSLQPTYYHDFVLFAPGQEASWLESGCWFQLDLRSRSVVLVLGGLVGEGLV